MTGRRISVLLADDDLLIREGLRALVGLFSDLEVVGVATEYDELLADVERLGPQVVVTDIRMPPAFEREGIDAALELRRRHFGTGVVVLSQYDEPELALALLREGAEGCAYLLKHRIADGEQLARAIRTVSTGGTLLDPGVLEKLVRPVADEADLTGPERRLLRLIAEGRSIKAIAATTATSAAAAAGAVDALFLKLARLASAGARGALRDLRRLHRAIVESEEQGQTLRRLLPGAVAERLRAAEDAHRMRPGVAERLVVTVLISDVRGYSAIAERADPAALAAQLNEHRAVLSRAILAEGGTLMQFVGDGTMAVFGAPLPQEGHAVRALAAAVAMHRAQRELNARWAREGLPQFPLAVGLSTGEVAAALLGSEERLEYSLVGDSVNLAQRLQALGDGGETVLSEATYAALASPTAAERIGPLAVKGRRALVTAYRLRAAG